MLECPLRSNLAHGWVPASREPGFGQLQLLAPFGLFRSWCSRGGKTRRAFNALVPGQQKALANSICSGVSGRSPAAPSCPRSPERTQLLKLAFGLPRPWLSFPTIDPS